MFRVSPVVYDPSCNFHLFITFEIPVALEAFIASKEVLVRRPAPPGIRPFLEINGQYSKGGRGLHMIPSAERINIWAHMYAFLLTPGSRIPHQTLNINTALF